MTPASWKSGPGDVAREHVHASLNRDRDYWQSISLRAGVVGILCGPPHPLLLSFGFQPPEMQYLKPILTLILVLAQGEYATRLYVCV